MKQKETSMPIINFNAAGIDVGFRSPTLRWARVLTMFMNLV